LPRQILRFVFEIDFNLFVRKVLLGQDNPCPVSVWSGVAGVELHHEGNLLDKNLITIITAFRQCRSLKKFKSFKVFKPFKTSGNPPETV